MLQTLKSRLLNEERSVRLKDSLIYAFYLKIRFPRDYQRLQHQVAFLGSLLGSKANLVFDVGANRGDKAKLFCKIFRKVLCVEPDPNAVRLLQKRFSHQKKILIVPKGVDQKRGENKFFQISEGNPRNSFSLKWIQGQCGQPPPSQKIEVTTLDYLIQQYGQPDLIKLDVEGFELRALLGLSIPVPVICFECNLPQFLHETAECVKNLSQKSEKYLFNYTDGEATRFILPRWEAADDFLKTISRFDEAYMEIYARLQP